MNYDPSFEAWKFFGFNSTFTLWKMDILDWFFYPVCGVFILFAMMWLDKYSKPRYVKDTTHYIYTGVLGALCLALFFLFPFGGCGWSINLCYFLPGVVMLAWKKFNIVSYLNGMMFIVLFACIWDILAVSTIPQMMGFNTSQWYYLNELNEHSKIFLSFKDYPWAYISRSPIEITPWFSIAGGTYIYGCYNLFIKK